MSFQIEKWSSYAEMVAANSDLRARLWEARVIRDARQRNVMREFFGREGSGKPIITKRDPSKGGAEQVVFTTIAPIRGQGVLHENILRTKTDPLRFGTFAVTVDLLRHAVSYSQVMKILRFRGKTLDQESSALMADWLARKEDDDIFVTFLRTARLVAPPGENLIYVGGGKDLSELTSADTLTVEQIETTKGLLMSKGAQPMKIDKDVTGADIPEYLFFGPDALLSPLRTSHTYQRALLESDKRGPENRLFTGKYAMWNNIAIYPQIVSFDDADGRQGTPWIPRAYLGTEIEDGSATEITGGGNAEIAGNGDYFANFPGYAWKIYDAQQVPADTGPHYAIIYNLTGADAHKYEIISYTTGNNGNKITGVSRNAVDVGSNYTEAHPSGSVIIPCSPNGVPYGYAAAMGAEALFYATGEDEAEPIEHWDDFRKVRDGQPHIKSIGLQSVRGMEPKKSTGGKYRNFLMVCGAVKVPDCPNIAPYLP